VNNEYFKMNCYPASEKQALRSLKNDFMNQEYFERRKLLEPEMDPEVTKWNKMMPGYHFQRGLYF